MSSDSNAAPNPREITWASIGLGLALGSVLAITNAYLSLYAGFILPAAIPASLLSLALLRGLLKKGSLLENNIVQTVASAGAATACGIAFTVPALWISGVWSEARLWPTILIALAGTTLGIMGTAALRRATPSDEAASGFPEGVACAELLLAAERRAGMMLTFGTAALIGAAYKSLTAATGWLRASAEWITTSSTQTYYLGIDFSPALLGVGIVAGARVSLLVFAGSAFVWLGWLPSLSAGARGAESAWGAWFWETWGSHGRYAGVGALAVAGIWAVFQSRSRLFSAVRGWILLYDGDTRETDNGISKTAVALLFGLAAGTSALLLLSLTGSFTIALVGILLVGVLSLPLIASAAQMTSVVGTTFAPVLAVTLGVVLAAGWLLSRISPDDSVAMTAVLIVSALAGCAAASAGDLAQSLRTGELVGASPRRQQWAKMLGAIVPALLVPPVLMAMHHAYGIGTGQPGALKAPQAAALAGLARTLFGDGLLPTAAILTGVGAALVVLVLDRGLRARASSRGVPVAAFAVGMYLPLALAIPILVGGLVALMAGFGAESYARRDEARGKAVRIGSGLIAGEAIAGVALALVLSMDRNALPWIKDGSIVGSCVSFAAVAILVAAWAKRREPVTSPQPPSP